MNKYKEGSIIKVLVTAIEPYGAFVRIDDEYTGLIHISEINGNYIKNINDYFEVGDVLSARVEEVDENTKHIKLTHKGVKNRYKFMRKELKDTELGFELLEELLPKWIDNKLKEIENSK